MIKSKYRRVWLIGRTLAGDEADQAKAYEIMKHYKLRSRTGGSSSSRPIATGARASPRSTRCRPMDPEFVAPLNQAMVNNPPPKRDRPLLERAGAARDRAGALTRGRGPAAGRARRALRRRRRQRRLRCRSPPSSASCSSRSTRRDGSSPTPPSAPSAPTIGSGPRSRSSASAPTRPRRRSTRRPRRLRRQPARRLQRLPDGLSGRRPAPGQYFWSLTMYDRDGYLVDNPIDRYSLGRAIRRCSTRPTARSSSRSPTTSRPTRRQLAAPRRRAFRLNMRLYGPSKRVLDGNWTPPAPVIQAPKP